MAETIAEMRLPTEELRDDIPFYTKVLGMKLDMIYPADDPRIGVFSGHGLRLRIERGAPEGPGTLRILTEDPEGFADGARTLTAPNGTKIEIEERNPPLVMPETVHSFVVRRLKDQAPWIIGRAGMHYRDLVPDRLGGSIIASHIRIPDGGPVPDMVHFHRVGFQLIFCIHGWVDVVYEDQGEKMRLTAGDCFIQPPEIRHRVLEASDNVQVIEIGVPAEHVTEIDHEMTLPTPDYLPDREWQGQRFVYNQAAGADWVPFRLPGFICRDTTINENTKGVASVQVVRPGEGADAGNSPWASHDTDILFTFVMAGTVTLHGEGREPYALETGDAFVIPPGMKTRLSDASDDLELLEVSLPGSFTTSLETS
ncbi:cupin domain-containing protein [Phaeobacter sp. QD34_3]|uniref:cupin domain-containing protein n=1 Tax=unclassified Phaeobacter TaxID=2621772 RepID=UPI00237F43D3|nr:MULTISPECIES: cupin domain-containing protein [unclassified Phaeobacter]MDE4134134.1 cupin domain-containing protein [Phaeobacter sp. QD34_3]MDE4137943.1 cupin domain-containing protein [Phaeobacter sp. QD34_24]